MTSQQQLNAEIDVIYGELRYLASRRASQTSTEVDAQVTALTKKLRALQNQEADMVRAYTKRELAPLTRGLEILDQADEILEKYGIVRNKDESL